MLTVKPVYKLLNVSEMDYKHTCDTIFTHCQGITNNIYGFEKPYFCSFIFYLSTIFHNSTRPYSFLPVQMKGEQVST